MSDVPEDRKGWWWKVEHRFSQWLMWWPPLRSFWGWLSDITHAPDYISSRNKFRDGLHDLAWMMVCGYGIKFAWKIALIHWGSDKGEQDE